MSPPDSTADAESASAGRPATSQGHASALGEKLAPAAAVLATSFAPATDAPAPALRKKPRLRGVSHQIAFFFAAAGWYFIVHQAATARAAWAVGIYGASLTTQLGVSALYHRPQWSRRNYAIMRRFDHSAIFVLIAGTYTPLCYALGGRRGMTLLTIVWVGAALGMLRAILWPFAPRWLSASLYVGLGWLVFPLLPQLYTVVGLNALLLLMAGGLAYSVGAIIYAVQRPNPIPHVFGFHEVFHVLVIVAAAFHYAVVMSVLPLIR